MLCRAPASRVDEQASGSTQPPGFSKTWPSRWFVQVLLHPVKGQEPP
jgi:hypothetical protein